MVAAFLSFASFGGSAHLRTPERPLPQFWRFACGRHAECAGLTRGFQNQLRSPEAQKFRLAQLERRWRWFDCPSGHRPSPTTSALADPLGPFALPQKLLTALRVTVG